MTTVLIDARLAIRGLGISAYIERLMEGFAASGSTVPSLWRGTGEWDRAGRLSTAGHCGLFDISPRLDPRTRKFDVVHFASNLGAIAPGPNSVVTVHDLMHRRGAAWPNRIAGALLERSLVRAGRVVAISDRTRTVIQTVLPSLAGQVEVIPHGMRVRPAPICEREHILAFGGASDPRKRTDLMVAAYRAYQARTTTARPLIVLARAGLTYTQRIELAQLGAKIIPSATAEEVDALMGTAAALLYPSREEGFGLPILEAAEARTPVVMDSAADVANEVAGRHCYLVSGTTADTWAKRLQDAVAGGPVDGKLKFPNWATVAASYESLYHQVGR